MVGTSKGGIRNQFHHVINIDRPQLTTEDIKKLEEGMAKAADAK